MMIVVKLAGGLGNQLFQYAAARSIALTNNTEVLLDLNFFKKSPNRSFSLNAFNIKADIAVGNAIYKALGEKRNYFIDKIVGRNRINENHPAVYKEPSFNYDKNLFAKNLPFYMDGYWQSERYFLNHEAEIRKDLQFKNEHVFENAVLVSEILNSNSVSVHLRRSDYISNEKINAIHGICSDEYYLNALNLLKEKIGEITMYVFSDDVKIADDFIAKMGNGINVSKFTNGNQLADFYLMQQCKHLIIANSTFSWWAAWLNANPMKIIIAPKDWFKDTSKNTSDLYPKSWIIL